VLAGSCRSSDNGVVTVIAPYTGAIDPTSSTVVADLGGGVTTSAVSGTVGFSTDIVLGIFTLTSLQAQITGPIQFFGRQIDALQVNLRRPLFGAEVATEGGFTQVTLPVQPDDLAAQVVVGGVPQFLSLDGVTSLSGTLSSDRSVLSLSASQTQASGDSISMNLTAVTSNSPPQPTITVAPGTTLECTGNRAASATFSATVVDPDSGDSIKRIQWFVRDENIGHGDTKLGPLGAGSGVTASLLLGQQQISAVAYDQHEAAGQSAVIVQVRDTIAPVVTAPPDQTFYAGVGGASIEVNLGNATIQEACDPRPVVSVVTSLDPDSPLRGATIPNPGDVVLPVGQIPIIWTVTDVSGNTASATQTVTVLAQDPPTGTPPPAPITIPAPQTCPAGTGAMLVSPPGSGQVSIDLNVCIVGRINAGVKEGAAPWESCQGQDDSCTDTAIKALLTTANNLFSGFVDFNYVGFKRIADPYPPAADGSMPEPFPCTSNIDGAYAYGDACVNATGLLTDNGIEINKMLSACYAMWGYPPPNAMGDTDPCQRPVTLLLVRAFDVTSQAPGVCGVGTAALTSSLSPSACMDPRTLANNTSGAFAYAATEGSGNSADNNCDANVPLTIAHELGHALGLGHGDGLDDDCNGVWDSLYMGGPCDPNEIESGAATLMDGDSTLVVPVVTPLQTDRARVFATKSVQANAGSTNSCPVTDLPAGPVDTKAPFAGCGCRVGGSPASIWAVGLLGLVVASRRRPRRRRRSVGNTPVAAPTSLDASS
jgi:MYXO-CTERM domain-containing protein